MGQGTGRGAYEAQTWSLTDGLCDLFYRSRGDSAVFVLNKDTSECVHYEPVSGYPPKSITRIPREIFESHPNIEIRNDFIDCFIDVCSVDVSSSHLDSLLACGGSNM